MSDPSPAERQASLSKIIDPVEDILGAIKTLKKKTHSHCSIMEILIKIPPSNTATYGEIVATVRRIHSLEISMMTICTEFSETIKGLSSVLCDSLAASDVAEEETETHADQEHH